MRRTVRVQHNLFVFSSCVHLRSRSPYVSQAEDKAGIDCAVVVRYSFSPFRITLHPLVSTDVNLFE